MLDGMALYAAALRESESDSVKAGVDALEAVAAQLIDSLDAVVAEPAVAVDRDASRRDQLRALLGM